LTHQPPAAARVAWLPLLIGIGLMLGITVYPKALIDPTGKADHLAVTLACWAMAAGLVRGVGFVPRHWLPRVLFSGVTCGLLLLASVLRMFLLRA